MHDRILIGVISDTHGLLRPEALAALDGCSAILHAGDVGEPEVLDELARIAPVTAIRGNVDTDSWAAKLPESVTVRFGGLQFFMLHDLKQRRSPPPGVDVVISGHSHAPRVEERGGILFVNPGSAGPRRFRLPVSLALLEIKDGRAMAKLIEVVSRDTDG